MTPSSSSRPRHRLALPFGLLAAAALSGCGSDEAAGHRGAPADAATDASPHDAGADGAARPLRWPHLECDPIVPSYCLFPFPSNVFTVEDPATPTGRRVAISESSTPRNESGVVAKPDPVNVNDGFSAGMELLAHLPGASLSGLPSPLDIERSITLDSPTILLDAETGELVPHFAELDETTTDVTRRAFMIRPVVRLRDSARYVVAIRHVVDEGGTPLPPSHAFRALRDGEPFDDPSVDARRDLYADIFARLAMAGVERDDLQLAWDFSTASFENNTRRLLHMRDDALAIVGEDGPDFTIDEVVTDWQTDDVAFRIDGTMKAPLYLDDPKPGGHLVLDEDGLPVQNPDQPFLDVPFEVIIPHSAETKPAAIVQYGHGLFGEKEQIRAGHFLSFMNEHGYVFAAVDMIGMSHSDPVWIGATVYSGDVENLSAMFDRMHQGMLNQWLCTRMMITGFARHPEYGKYVDPTRRYYHGISQGGILGGVYLPASPDVDRGVLGVMGQPYNLLLSRSVDFDAFNAIVETSYEDPRDRRALLATVQMMWDRVDPSGYTAYMTEGEKLGVGPKTALLRAAVGDHQVPTLGAHIMARAIGAKHVDTGVRDVFGLEKVAATTEGSAYVEYDFGLPPVPVCNVPMRLCSDPHGELRSLPAARTQMDRFLRTGEVKNDCGGPCSFPELSGCGPDDVGDPCGG